MRTSTLLARNLAWYWRTNLAVLLGVATAAGVLGGALLVGDSVRASLRDLVLARLGNTRYVVSRNGFFREELASALVASACPMIAIERHGGARTERAPRVGRADLRRRRTLLEISGEPALAAQVLLSAALATGTRREAGDSHPDPRGEAFGDSARVAARPQGGCRQDRSG